MRPPSSLERDTLISDVDTLHQRLESLYTANAQYDLAAQGKGIIDAHDARTTLLVKKDGSSGTMFACFVDDKAAWLISLSSTPLGYGELYQRIFDMACSSLRVMPD